MHGVIGQLAGGIFPYGPPKVSPIFSSAVVLYNKYLINLIGLGCTGAYGPSIFSPFYGPRASRLGYKTARKFSGHKLPYGPRTRLIRGIYQHEWKLGKREIVWKHDARRADCFHIISTVFT